MKLWAPGTDALSAYTFKRDSSAVVVSSELSGESSLSKSRAAGAAGATAA